MRHDIGYLVGRLGSLAVAASFGREPVVIVVGNRDEPVSEPKPPVIDAASAPLRPTQFDLDAMRAAEEKRARRNAKRAKFTGAAMKGAGE